MESLLARYLDGTLDEQEAQSLLRRAQEDPTLERALRAYERILTAASDLPRPQPHPSLTAGVMRRVRAVGPLTSQEHRTWRSAQRWRLWPKLSLVRLAATGALAIVLFLTGGVASRWLEHSPGKATGTGAPAASHSIAAPVESGRTLLAGAPWVASLGSGDRRLVRLAYIPEHPGVQRVTVAGSFNEWDPAGIPMRREGKVFVAVLALPPGAYEYMFVENGERWITDPLALQTRDDGFGNENAVLDLSL